jgi:hypothetical protein
LSMVHSYAALANPPYQLGIDLPADTAPGLGFVGGCGTNSASGQTEILPQRPQQPPTEFETQAQLSQ